MFQCYSLKTSHRCLLPLSPKICSLHLCLLCCAACRIVVTVFLNPIYTLLYTVFIFLFLTYFTMYNSLQFHPPRWNWLKCVPFYSWVIFHCVYVISSFSTASLSWRNLTRLWFDQRCLNLGKPNQSLLLWFRPRWRWFCSTPPIRTLLAQMLWQRPSNQCLRHTALWRKYLFFSEIHSKSDLFMSHPTL